MSYEFDVRFFNRLVVEHMYASQNGEDQAAQSLREVIDYMNNKHPKGWQEYIKAHPMEVSNDH